MSLLTAVQNACGELNLLQPTQVIGNTDPQVTQLLALANREGAEFAAQGGQWGGWPELNKVQTFNLVPAGPFTGNVVAGSTFITGIANTSTILVGYGVSGPGTYQSATIIAVVAGSRRSTAACLAAAGSPAPMASTPSSNKLRRRKAPRCYATLDGAGKRAIPDR